MEPKKYEIRITGSGDKYELMEALEKIICDLKWSTEEIGEADPWYEDKTLYMVVTEKQ